MTSQDNLQLQKIEQSICAAFGVSRKLLMSTDHQRLLSWARSLSAYLARELTQCTGKELSQWLGKKGSGGISDLIARVQQARRASADASKIIDDWLRAVQLHVPPLPVCYSTQRRIALLQYRPNWIHHHAKRYVVTAPDGEEHITYRGLADFCREHGLNPDSMSKVAAGHRPSCNGWQVKDLTISSESRKLAKEL